MSSETKMLLSKIRKGRKLNDIHKANISKSLKGRKCTWADKIIKSKSTKPIIQYDTDGYYINEYNSVKEAYNKTKIKICTIYKCLSGSNKTAGGFIWKYKEN